MEKCLICKENDSIEGKVTCHVCREKTGIPEIEREAELMNQLQKDGYMDFISYFGQFRLYKETKHIAGIRINIVENGVTETHGINNYALFDWIKRYFEKSKSACALSKH